MSKSIEVIRAPYDGLQDEYSAASGIICLEPMTVQSESQSSDLNFLLRSLRGMDGVPVLGDSEKAFYGDVSEMGDFQACLDAVTKAGEAFMAQPAHIRDRFENDAGKFLDFVSDVANRDEAMKLGLIEADVIPPVVPPIGG